MTRKASLINYFLLAFTLTFLSSGLTAGTLGLDGKKRIKRKKKNYRPTDLTCSISLMGKSV